MTISKWFQLLEETIQILRFHYVTFTQKTFHLFQPTFSWISNLTTSALNVENRCLCIMWFAYKSAETELTEIDGTMRSATRNIMNFMNANNFIIGFKMGTDNDYCWTIRGRWMYLMESSELHTYKCMFDMFLKKNNWNGFFSKTF